MQETGFGHAGRSGFATGKKEQQQKKSANGFVKYPNRFDFTSSRNQCSL
jgi:hypothetical protein